MARPHPHHFAYTMLPQLVWRRPAAVRRELTDPLLARELLLYIWDKAAESLPPRERVAPRGLHLSWHQVAGRATALLQLPPPQALGPLVQHGQMPPRREATNEYAALFVALIGTPFPLLTCLQSGNSVKCRLIMNPWLVRVKRTARNQECLVVTSE